MTDRDRDFWRLGKVRYRPAGSPEPRQVLCTTCSAPCRYDEPYWMCDDCKRVVAWDIEVF